MAVVVPITADFDPAGIKQADAAFKSFGQNLARTLNQASRVAAASLNNVEDAATDTRTAAQRLAAAIDKTSASLQADIQKSAVAARALGDALGPELSAKLGRNGIQSLIRDFSRMGLTLQDVTDEAELLAQSVRQVSDLNVDPLNACVSKLDDGMRKVGDTTDKSRSVFANFAGNASQELPGLAGAFGPLNTAIGQFAEYASEGGISLAGFASQLGPLVAIGGAIFVIKGAFDASAKAAKLLKENTELAVDALFEGKDAVDVLYDKLREAREIESFDPGKGPFGDVTDITADLYKLGIPLANLEAISKRGEPALRLYIKGLEAAYENLRTIEINTGKAQDKTRSYEKVIRFLNDQLKVQAKAALESAADIFVFGRNLSDAERETIAAADAVAYSRVELSGLGSATDSAAFAQAEFERRMAAVRAESEQTAAAIATARGEFFAFLDIERTEKENADATTRARNELTKARKRGNAKDIVDAEERYLQAIQNEAEYTGEAFLQTSKIRDEKIKQALATEAVIRQLQDEADALAPGSPLQKNLQSWIRALKEDLPKELTTNILARYSGVVSTTGNMGLGPNVPPPPNPFGAGGINITVNTLNADEAAAKAVARGLNNLADQNGQPRPFANVGI